MKKYQIDKIQIVWWWRFPYFRWWAFPITYKEHDALKGKPMFWGLYLGILEFRFYPIR